MLRDRIRMCKIRGGKIHMKSIAAINLEIGKDLVVDEIEIPDPRPDQVVVKLSSSGVCHSQLHQIHQI